MITNIFFLIGCTFFIIASTIHLIACAKSNRKLQIITKPMLMPLILASSILVLTFRWPDSKNLIIFTSFAITFACMGNIFFIRQERIKMLAFGILFFGLSNLNWIVILFPSIKLFPLNPFFKIVFILFYIGIIFISIFTGRKLSKAKIALISAFALILCALNYTTLATLVGARTLYSLLLVFGTILLMAASYLYLMNLCGKSTKNNQFFVMLTYLVAQVLISAGIIMMIY